MKSCVAILLFALAVVLSPPAQAAGKKNDKAVVSFHIQAEAIDNPKMIFPYKVGGETQYFRRMPEFHTKDIKSFASGPSVHEDGEFTVVFRLKRGAIQRLQAVTTANQGRWMAAQLNGRVIDCVMVDAPVEDGVLVIWNGVTAADVNTLEKALKRTKE